MTAEASCHGDQPPTTAVVTPRRRRAAAPTRPIASTASPTPVPIGALGPASGSSSPSSAVNTAPISCARAVNRRSQPRTVEAARPNCAAIRR